MACFEFCFGSLSDKVHGRWSEDRSPTGSGSAVQAAEETAYSGALQCFGVDPEVYSTVFLGVHGHLEVCWSDHHGCGLERVA